MAQYDDSTFLEAPLPHPDNPAREDAGRIREFLETIDDALANQADAINDVDEALAAEVTARNAAIGLAVANAVTALINGAATDVDTLGEIAAKIVSDYYTKTQVDAALAALGSGSSHAFTVDTNVAVGDRLALKSNGHVEIVAGTRTAAAVGADATISSISLCDIAFNASVGKIAVFYNDSGYKVVIGSISGNTITWGTPVSTGVSFAAVQNKITWSADGGRIFCVGRVSTTAMTGIAATVSGTVPTFGSSAAATVTTSATPSYIGFDATGNRLIVFCQGVNQIFAFGVSSTTLTPGSVATLTTTGGLAVCFFDEANARFVYCSTNGATQVKCAAATFSGTTATAGSEVTVATASDNLSNPAFAMDASGKVLALFSPSNSDTVTSVVISFSGTVPSAGTAASLNIANGGNVGVRMAYDSTAAKFVCVVSRTGTATPLLMMVMATISGTSVSFSAVTHFNEGKPSNSVLNLLVLSGSNYAIAVSDPDSYGYRVLWTSSLSGGVVVAGEKYVYRANELSTESGVFAIPASNKVCIIGFESTASSTYIGFVVQLPVESTNAGKFIGISQETKTVGQTAKVTPKGVIATVPAAGLTIDADYYIAHDGALTTTKTKVKAGRAISTTELLLAA